MNQFIYGTAVVLILGATASAEPPQEQPETETIRLDQIWAYQMPGTRNILDLVAKIGSEQRAELGIESAHEVTPKKIWAELAISLSEVSSFWPGPGRDARKAFAVSGCDVEALLQAYGVIVRGDTPSKSFSSRKPITIVFFTYQCPNYVHLDSVERCENEIAIRYRFMQPVNRIQSVQLALVPLGRLPIGKYDVAIDQEPMGQQQLDGGFEPRQLDTRLPSRNIELDRRVVCKSSTFSIIDDGD
jgi:hypothetical protein